MKALLVEPVLNAPILEPPLGMLSIATVAQARGHDVRVTSLRFDKDTSRLKGLLESFAPDVVGISINSVNLRDAFHVIKIVRLSMPGVRIAVGGPHATAMPEHTLEFLKADFIFIGESEESFNELLDNLDNKGDGESIPGILAASRKTRYIQRTPISHLDDLPIIDRDLIDIFNMYLSVSAEGLMPDPCSTINISRGCPGKCIFCQPLVDKMFGTNVRQHSPERVAEEIRLLRDRYKIASVQVVDDTVIIGSKKGHALVSAIAGCKLPWAINTRVDFFDEESASLLKEAGCFKVLIGMESGSQKILDNLQKGITPGQIRNCIRLCNKYGIHTKVSVMIGNPGETLDDLEQTLSLLAETQPDFISVNYTKPTIGSFLFDRIKGFDFNDSSTFIDLSNRSIPFNGLHDIPLNIMQNYFKRILALNKCHNAKCL